MAENTQQVVDVPTSAVTRPEAHDDAVSPATQPVATGDLIETELLIEDVSIDGMCGVY